MAQQSADRIEVPLSWVGVDGVAVLPANQFFFVDSDQSEEVIFSIGHVVPPPLSGSPEELRRQIGDIEFIPVKTIARLSMTRAVADQLRTTINLHMEKLEKRRVQ